MDSALFRVWLILGLLAPLGATAQSVQRDVRVGVYGNKPKIFLNEEGHPDGIFPDVLEAIAERADWRLTWVPCEWATCLEWLREGRIDLLPDVAYSHERRGYLGFHSDEVLESWSQIFVDPALGIESWADLDGRRIAVLRGSFQASGLVERFAGFGFDVEVVETGSWEDAFAAVRDGQADAAIPNHFFGNYHYREYGLERTPVMFDAHSLFFATAKGVNADLLATIDIQLEALKSEPESPYYAAVAQWMDRPPKPVLPRYIVWMAAVGVALLLLAIAFIRLLQFRVRMRTRHLAEANQALRRSEAKFRSIFENNTASKMIVDPVSGRLSEANQAAVEWFGWPKDELMKMDIRDLTVDRDADNAWFREAAAGGKHGQYEVRMRRSDERVGDVELFTAHVQFNHTLLLHVIVYDITEHRLLQEQVRQMQKMEAIGRLAGGVAHDFNNFLSVIIGHSELALYEMAKDAPLRNHVQEILNAANRSKAVTQQLMAFARRDVMRPEVVDLNARVGGMMDLLRSLTGEEIDLTWKPASDAWPVFTDPAQVDQIVTNLCVNARDAIEDRGHIELETSNVEYDETWCASHPGFEPGGYVRLTISDDGIGMDKETLDNIFEPFFTTKELGHGTGLGLATVYGIVRQNKGFINVYSEPGMGTTFRVYLPRYIGEQEDPVGKKVEKPAHVAGEGIILVVDDEVAIVEMTRMALESMGYTVLSASSPAEALSVAEGREIDLLVTDVVMPEMNGRELAGRLIREQPDMACLFMSGYTENILAHKGVLGAGVQLIQKPFTLGELSEAVQRVLG